MGSEELDSTLSRIENNSLVRTRLATFRNSLQASIKSFIGKMSDERVDESKEKCT